MSNAKANHNSAKVVSSEDWLKAMKKAADKAPPLIRPYVLLDSLNFAYPDKSDEEKSKILKTAENNAEFLYSLLRSKYKKGEEDLFHEAISSLDYMKEKYMTLKAKKLTINELLDITGKWFTFLNCIEVMVANIASDPALLKSAEDLSPQDAKILSKEILSNFEVKIQVARSLGL